MIVKRYVFDIIDSNMYLCIDGDYGIIIDPFDSDSAKRELLAGEVKRLYIILTHEHIDHISGVNFYSDFETIVCCSKECRSMINNRLHELKMQFASIFMKESAEKKEKVRKILKNITNIKIDKVLYDKEELMIGKHKLFIRYTCGHSPGSIIIVMDDSLVFTGDTLLTDRKSITNLPGGNQEKYDRITVPILNQLNGELMIYPGHGNIEKLSALRRK